jgi:hypothetical protein
MDKLAALDLLRANEAELRRRGVLHAALSVLSLGANHRPTVISI